MSTPPTPAPVPIPIRPVIQPNRVYASVSSPPEIDGGAPSNFTIVYTLITPAEVQRQSSITMSLSYGCADIRDLVENAIQAQESDDTLEVIFLL